MGKIRIITDSASDLGQYREDLTVLPLTVSFGDEEYLDGVTIDHHTFFEKLIESDVLPKTSLVSPGAFEEVFARGTEAGEEMIVITVSSKLSGTHQSAVIAAEDYENVHIIDSYIVTIGQKILVEYALSLVDQGMDAKSIVKEIEDAKNKIHVLGVLDTLEYLKKGGRISSTTALIGGALSIKPVVTVQDGEVKMIGKARGSKNGNNYLIKEVEKVDGVDFGKPFCLGYTGLDDSMLQKYIKDSKALWEGNTDELPICSIGAAIGTHVGPNAVAVAFFEKTK
ncbi:MAG: DegV family protein [Eubacteriales bacterium]|nr:DegV family protein [Eubacteriales bacterium]